MTKEPVTISGWYEHVDGKWGRYGWVEGKLHLLDCVAADAPRPTESERAMQDEPRSSVVTYQLAYRSEIRVDLCNACAERGDHDCGTLGPVQHGAHAGLCDGAFHGLVRRR